MNAQDIVNFYGKPVDKKENKYLYDRLIDLFGQGVDGNSNGIIGDNLIPAWTHPEIEEVEPDLTIEKVITENNKNSEEDHTHEEEGHTHP